MGTDGIDAEAVTAWLAERRDIEPPLTFETIAGGRSNLTYTVTDDAGERYVLRRPPLHSVLESAHDVAREARIMAALADSDVPVPVVVDIEEDESVNGAPFFMMEFTDGAIARDAAAARELLDEDERATASASLVQTLLALHDTDPDEVGLGQLGRRTGYVERQLQRWSGQLEKGSDRDLPLLVELGTRLADDVPEAQATAIVHGDYRLDNLILAPDGSEVRAVLDWELCTLGDPLADVGMLNVYWAEESDGVSPLGDMPTILPGFWSRQQVMDAYADGSSLDLSELDFYIAFAYWRLAIILEGVYQRFSAGAYDHDDEGVRAFGEVVHRLAEAADERARAAGR